MARESRLAEIYKMELKNKGLLGALVSAVGERTKEKTDLRRLLPSSGITGAAFGKIFGKAYKYNDRPKSSGGASRGVGSSGDSGMSQEVNEKLTRISTDNRITAKNTIVLPAMARDMNLMRMNMQKMVKLSGGTPSTKSDMFFKRAGDREAQYEGQYKKNSGGLAPTPVGEKKEGGGLFDILKGVLSMSFGSIIESLISGLLKGGLLLTLLNGIGKYFQDKEFRDSVNNLLDGFFKTVFGEEYKKNLATGALILTGAYIAFKGSLALLEVAILAAAKRIGMLGGPSLPSSSPSSGPGGKGGKGVRGGWLKTVGKGMLLAGAVELLTEGVAYYLKQGESKEEAEKLAKDDIANQSRSPGEEPAPKKPEGMRGSEMVEKAGSATKSAITIASGVNGLSALTPSVPSASPAASGKLLTPFGSVGANREMEKNKTLWEKIVKVIKKASVKGLTMSMITKIGGKFGPIIAGKIFAAVAGIVAAPFSAGISLLITAIGVGMLAKDLFDLYEWFVEYEKELDAYEKSSSPTPVADSTSNLTSTSEVNAAGTVTSTPGGAAVAVQRTPRKITSGAATTSTTPTPSNKSTPIQTDGLALLNSIMDREGITDASVRDRIIGVAQIESSMNPNAKGPVLQSGMHKGDQAQGLLQIMPKTAPEVGFSAEDIRDPTKAATAGVRYFIKNLNKFKGNLDAATVAHHSGPGGAEKFLKTGSAGTVDLETGLSTDNYLAKIQRQASMASSSPSSGTVLASASTTVADGKMAGIKSGGNTVVNAPVTNNMSSGGGGGNMATASVYDNELAKKFFNSSAFA